MRLTQSLAPGVGPFECSCLALVYTVRITRTRSLCKKLFVVNCLEDFSHVLDIDDVMVGVATHNIYSHSYSVNLYGTHGHVHMQVDSWAHRVVPRDLGMKLVD